MKPGSFCPIMFERFLEDGEARFERIAEVTGYRHPKYAESLEEFGDPRELKQSGAWILERGIPGATDKDAIGCYPLFVCEEWSRLHADLEDIGNEIVTLSLVTDPFGNYDADYLRQCFRDVVIPFKEHFVIDLSRPVDALVSNHHRRYARKALRQVCAEKCEDPTQFIDEWVNLYAVLVARHNIRGITAFSRTSFARQLKVPGIVVFRAVHNETTVGMLLWYVQDEIGYYHLGAYSSEGYELRASFALFWFAIECFSADGLQWLNLGAGAGVKSDGTDGLSRFKRGWSSGTRTAYFCGRIFNHERYSDIMNTKGISGSEYFPAYRTAELR